MRRKPKAFSKAAKDRAIKSLPPLPDTWTDNAQITLNADGTRLCNDHVPRLPRMFPIPALLAVSFDMRILPLRRRIAP